MGCKKNENESEKILSYNQRNEMIETLSSK